MFYLVHEPNNLAESFSDYADLGFAAGSKLSRFGQYFDRCADLSGYSQPNGVHSQVPVTKSWNLKASGRLLDQATGIDVFGTVFVIHEVVGVHQPNIGRCRQANFNNITGLTSSKVFVNEFHDDLQQIFIREWRCPKFIDSFFIAV